MLRLGLSDRRFILLSSSFCFIRRALKKQTFFPQQCQVSTHAVLAENGMICSHTDPNYSRNYPMSDTLTGEILGARTIQETVALQLQENCVSRIGSKLVKCSLKKINC